LKTVLVRVAGFRDSWRVPVLVAGIVLAPVAVLVHHQHARQR
jgi:hypothetical protein